MEGITWHSLPEKKLKQILQTDFERGLSEEEVKIRLKKYGTNEIKIQDKFKVIRILLNQVNSILVWILIVAVGISYAFGEVIDAVLISSIILANTILGFFQEYKSEKAIEALRRMLRTEVKVIRAGKVELIDSKYLVPGDIVILKAGDKVPADIRIIEEDNLYVDESILTGESVPVKKTAKTLPINIDILDMKNMLFMNTYVVKGRCKGVVISTGNQTFIGRIAKKISEEKRSLTPLEKELNRVGKIIGLAVIVITIVLFALSIIILKLNPIFAILTSISLAVAAVPEGLPMIVTLTLSISAKRLLKSNVLVKRLPSAQTLGSVDTICTDKTGTITVGKMTVKEFYYKGRIYEVEGEGYEPKGRILLNGKEVKEDLSIISEISYYCNDSILREENGTWKGMGDPTELALMVLSKKIGVREDYKRIKTFDFDRIRKMMSVVVQKGSKLYVFVKGAPDVLLRRSSHMLSDTGLKKIDGKTKKELQLVIEGFAEKGYRTIGLAYKEVKEIPEKVEEAESNLVFVSVLAILDPPRPEVKEAVEIARRAGIDIIVITGDHPLTAKTVCKMIGLEANAITGKELDSMSDEEVYNLIKSGTKIFARVTPDHKYRIVKILRKRGKVVAMTGDGVNDAPALKISDIGIAVNSGTDVAKEASDMILLDNNFASIVKAIKEGRRILSNIREFVFYLLSSNVGEVTGISLPAFMGLGIPLEPVHILWINLVTDGLIAFGLGLDPAPSDVLIRKPEQERKILSKSLLYELFIFGIVMGLFVALAYSIYKTWIPLKEITIVFTLFVIFEISRLIYIRNRLKINMFSNKILWTTVVITLVLQAILIYTPLNSIFDLVPLNLRDWGIIMAFLIGLILLQKIISYGVQKFVKDEL